MNRQGKVWITAGLVAIVAAACFDDPTSSLQGGPAALNLSRAAVTVRAGDSVAVTATVVDAQGNPLATSGVTWTSADPAVAAVTEDVVRPAPGAIFTRAFVRGVSNQAGITSVTLAANGLTAQLRVTVLPGTFPGAFAVTGTAGPDTVVINRPAPNPPLVVAITAGDTLQLTATPTVTFSATTSTVTFGAFAGYIVSRSATQIKAVSRQAYAGRVTITNLTYSGDAATGPVAIASLRTDSIQIQHGRFRGTAVSANSSFGTNTQLTVTAATNTSFNVTSSGVVIGSVAGIVLSRTATTMTAIFPANVTGSVMVTGATLNGATTVFDSLRAGTVANGSSVTVSASFFPGTVTNPGGRLSDTIFIAGGGQAFFRTANNAASISAVTVGGVPAYVVFRDTNNLKVLAAAGASGAVVITNPIVAGVIIPSLTAQGTTTINGADVSTEPNEPANDAPNGTVITLGTVAFPRFIGGSVNTATDPNDFFTFTIAAATTVNLRVDFAGPGLTPDVDLLVCTNVACTAFAGGFGGANAAVPQVLTLTALAAGTYHIWVNAYDSQSSNAGYRLTANGP